MLVSIIVPAYRQERTIKKDIKNIYDSMLQTRWDFELIVVVDGKVDKTLKEAKKVKGENIKIFGYDKNFGKGYAIKYGMARSSGDIVAFIDAGMDIDPNGVSMLLEHMEWYEADIVVGSKKHPAARCNYPLIRRAYSWWYYLLIKILFGLKVKDTQTGLKVFKRKVLVKVLPRLLVKEFAFDIEILAVARHLGFTRIYEAPTKVEWKYSATSFRHFLFNDPHIRKIFWDTLAVFYRLKIQRYYDNGSKRRWVYDKDLEMRINTGEMGDG